MVGTKRKRGGKNGGGEARRSRYVGVYWHTRDQKWYVRFTIRGVKQYLGTFHDEADAARAYDAAMAAQNLQYKRNFPANTGAEQAVKRTESRDNVSAIPDKGKSRFFGVSWNKKAKKWAVRATDNGKQKYLGSFDDETAAAWAFDAYVIANKINTDLNFPSAPGAVGHRTTKKGRTSRYRGVWWNKIAKKWKVAIWVDGKSKHLGTFVDEDDAAWAFDAYVIAKKIDRQLNFPCAPGAAGHRPTQKGRTSSHRGVSWDKSKKKWRAKIGVDGKVTRLGTFVDEDDAARAYDAAVRKHYPGDKPVQGRAYNLAGSEGGDDASDDGGDSSSSSSSSEEAAADRPPRQQRKIACVCQAGVLAALEARLRAASSAAGAVRKRAQDVRIAADKLAGTRRAAKSLRRSR